MAGRGIKGQRQWTRIARGQAPIDWSPVKDDVIESRPVEVSEDELAHAAEAIAASRGELVEYSVPLPYTTADALADLARMATSASGSGQSRAAAHRESASSSRFAAFMRARRASRES